ncbi:MAG: D-alanyl-D-alanine carboxypeptidase family protein [Segniliparus sp.]|uniref:D-alanyl-D-alanine carboxypeptidase family protein n=1 Tax=Segniliparus sp. TaxID=2804064 RepID=UPI003F3E7A15
MIGTTLRNLIAAAAVMAAAAPFAAADPEDSPTAPAQASQSGVAQPSGSAPVPAGSAPAWLVADLDTGQVLAARNPHGRYHPASTIKTLLALVVLNELDPGQKITETAADAAADSESIVRFIQPGTTHTVHELLEALLMISSNGAANALAGALGGPGPAVAKMNAEAASLGAHDTRATTPSGLEAPGVSSSPHDLALFFRAGLKNPVFARIVGQETAAVGGASGPELVNRDPLLNSYPGILGGKTGFTDEAQYNFVGAAAQEGRRLVVAVMDNPGTYPTQQASALLDWGFQLEPGLGVGTLG